LSLEYDANLDVKSRQLCDDILTYYRDRYVTISF
jgi:hypothetical protein